MYSPCRTGGLGKKKRIRAYVIMWTGNIHILTCTFPGFIYIFFTLLRMYDRYLLLYIYIYVCMCLYSPTKMIAMFAHKLTGTALLGARSVLILFCPLIRRKKREYTWEIRSETKREVGNNYKFGERLDTLELSAKFNWWHTMWIKFHRLCMYVSIRMNTWMLSLLHIIHLYVLF